MLDEVLRLVESREVSQVKEIFHGERRSLPPGYLEKEVPEEPDVGVAFVGLFFAATELNELVTKIDGIVDSYEDMMTVLESQLMTLPSSSIAFQSENSPSRTKVWRTKVSPSPRSHRRDSSGASVTWGRPSVIM